MAILVSPRSFRGRDLQKEAEIKGRLLTYQFALGGVTFVVGFVYAPNDGQVKFLLQALQEAAATADRHLLVGGTSILFLTIT